MTWYNDSCAVPSATAQKLARARQLQLTKPAGSLGRLETIAEQFAGWQRSELPVLEQIVVRIFAADHGVCAQGVSAFPSEVTTQMIGNFLNGGAAISVLSRAEKADFAVVNMGTIQSVAPAAGLINVAVAPGTADFTCGEAMTDNIMQSCMNNGRSLVNETSGDLFIAGEMGIGNTTSASAICAALLSLSAEDVVGRGTGVDDEGLMRKQRAVGKGIALHTVHLHSPLGVLRCLGGLEIAAMCGAYIRCAQRGIPILLDGFIAGSAALLASKINPGVTPWLMAGHESTEPAHQLILSELSLKPILSLGMRLGEDSGAALALPIIRSALRLHSQMATFSEAAVSGMDAV